MQITLKEVAAGKETKIMLDEKLLFLFGFPQNNIVIWIIFIPTELCQ